MPIEDFKREMRAPNSPQERLYDMKEKEDRYCGECCWFYGEDTDGYGVCPFKFADVRKCEQPCEAGEHFVSKKQMRHHQAVLLQANRYRRDQNVPAIYRMPNPTELGKAIDFAGEFIKVFSNL